MLDGTLYPYTKSLVHTHTLSLDPKPSGTEGLGSRLPHPLSLVRLNHRYYILHDYNVVYNIYGLTNYCRK